MFNKSPQSAEPLLWKLIPDETERAEFIKQVQSELANPAYHIYCVWYIQLSLVRLMRRHLLLARKPSVKT
jgi:hypothetical protein